MADIEIAKRNAANQAVKDHYDPNARYVGIGSGSTIVFVVEAIKKLYGDSISRTLFIPTGYGSRQVILEHGLQDFKYDSLPSNVMIDIAFDGADEVDEDLNCIKGGGACLYQEKLVATRAKKFICVADHRKLQPRLLTKWPSIPIEVEPLASRVVLHKLRSLGSKDPAIRTGQLQKAGPIKTDQDNFIVDAPFPNPLILPTDIAKANSLHETHEGVQGDGQDGKWEVERLADRVKRITGVLEVGIFSGMNGLQVAKLGEDAVEGGQKPMAAYFGMEDGSVNVREAGEDGTVTLRKVEKEEGEKLDVS
ncbi:MAG: hypothetical protein Q9220_001647 [cf. Caloplaca sp. 1 TL-2023]